MGLATEIPLTYENQTAQTFYIVNYCGQKASILEQIVEGAWEQFWSPTFCSRLGPPIVVEPGGVLADTLDLWGAPPGSNAAPQFASDDVEGTYRIVTRQVVFNFDADRPDLGDPVGLEYRVSNAFFLDDPRR